MKRAAIYARFSSELQSESSIDDQIALCRTFCIREGFAIAAEHSDRALSGASVHGRAGLAALREDVIARRCDVVVVEDFDRLSRGMGDLPKLWEEMQFSGVQLIAVNDGAADQIKIGVRGIVGALYLTDLRNKTRRGLEGKLRAGMRAGGLPYGYRPIAGRPGEHVIYEPEAEIVRRIFREYAAGGTPRTIAYGLNKDAIPPVRGRAWNASTLNGSQKRGTGLLANEIYRGEIVWNKVGKMKNPATGKRVPRINARSEWRHVPAPHLRIVDDVTFEAVQAERQRRANGPMVRRNVPQRLLSGLLKCSVCGSSVVAAGSKKGRRFGMCTRARESGSCENRRVVFLDVIENAVIEGLKAQLTHPLVIAEAARAYHAEMRRLDGERSRTRATDERRAGELRRSIDRMVDSLAAGEVSGAIIGPRIAEAEIHLNKLERAMGGAAVPEVVTLHPKAIEHYLAAVSALADTLAAGNIADAAKPIRELVHSIVIYPRSGREPVRFDIRGRLAALLNDAGGKGLGPLVPRDRIELPTRGFSIHCSTD
jgi:site-specific DNA recombinase